MAKLVSKHYKPKELEEAIIIIKATCDKYFSSTSKPEKALTSQIVTDLFDKGYRIVKVDKPKQLNKKLQS